MAEPSSEFAFREFEAGPRRDTARAFYDLVVDLSWLKGPKKEEVLAKLLEARNVALEVAESMLR